MRLYKCPHCKNTEFTERVSIEKNKGKTIWHRNPPFYCENCKKSIRMEDLE